VSGGALLLPADGNPADSPRTEDGIPPIGPDYSREVGWVKQAASLVGQRLLMPALFQVAGCKSARLRLVRTHQPTTYATLTHPT
ncbi:MAG: hypothetical protein U1E05_13600, partial [Patescibacteria group bacterium]|nr:hypothetical protein [Patescibacteria group bacterium]